MKKHLWYMECQRQLQRQGLVDEIVPLESVADTILKNVGGKLKMDVSQYLEIFIDETSEHIQSLNDCIMTLEKEPENKDTINEIFRAAHSLKGMAGTMGFKRMQHLTHDMENVFQEVRSDKVKVTSEMIDILFQCLDAIESYLDTIKSTSDEGTEDNEALITALNKFLENAENGGAAAPAKEEKREKKQKNRKTVMVKEILKRRIFFQR